MVAGSISRATGYPVGYTQVPVEDFIELKQKMQKALAESEGGGLAVARLNLARFYFAHGRGSETLGTRTELKNMNSFRAVEDAIRAEVRRQVELVRESSDGFQYSVHVLPSAVLGQPGDGQKP